MKNLFFALAVFIFSACSSSRKLSEKTTSDVKPSYDNIADSSYSLVVSFISIGSGTDRIARKEYESFIKQFEEHNKAIILLKKVNWGREGEIDFCIKLSNLNNDLQKNFIEETKNMLKDLKLVRIEENSNCK